MKLCIISLSLFSLFVLLALPIVSCSDSQVTYGISLHGFNHVKGVLVEQSGCEWIRTDVGWNGSFLLGLGLWSGSGSCLGYADYGQKFLGILDCWTMNLSDTFTLSDWDTRVNDTLHHFGDSIQAYEIWNEPNVYEYQYGYLNNTEDTIEHYFHMLRNASILIRAYNSSLVVVGGALGDIYVHWAGESWETWFTELLELGANEYVDVWSIHLYAGQKEAFVLEKMYALSGKPIWVTEIGYSVTQGEDVQADWVESCINRILASDVLPHVIMVYGLCGGDEFEYGLVDADYNKRLVYDVYTSFACADDEDSGLLWYQSPITFGIVVFGVMLGIYFFKRRY